MENNFEVKVNAKTHLVVESNTGRCLGGVGANFYRPFVFRSTHQRAIPLFRNSPLIIRSTTVFLLDKDRYKSATGKPVFGHLHPRRSWTDKVFERLGRMDTQKDIDITPHADGVQFVQNVVWRDDNEEPLVDEIRTVIFTHATMPPFAI